MLDNKQQNQKETRLVSIDTLRGFSMLWIIGAIDVIIETSRVISEPFHAYPRTTDGTCTMGGVYFCRFNIPVVSLCSRCGAAFFDFTAHGERRVAQATLSAHC